MRWWIWHCHTDDENSNKPGRLYNHKPCRLYNHSAWHFYHIDACANDVTLYTLECCTRVMTIGPSWTIKCSFDMMTRWTNSLVGHFNCRNSCMPNTNSQVLVMNSWYKASEYLAIVNSETCSLVFLFMSIFSELMYIDIVSLQQYVNYHERNCNVSIVMYQLKCINGGGGWLSRVWVKARKLLNWIGCPASITNLPHTVLCFVYTNTNTS